MRRRQKISPKFHAKNGVKNGKFHANLSLSNFAGAAADASQREKEKKDSAAKSSQTLLNETLSKSPSRSLIHTQPPLHVERPSPHPKISGS